MSRIKMTIEEAIKVLQSLIPTPTRGDARSTEHMKISIALLMAIKALEYMHEDWAEYEEYCKRKESEEEEQPKNVYYAKISKNQLCELAFGEDKNEDCN